MKRALLVAVVFLLAALLWILHEVYQPYRAYAGEQVFELKPGTSAPETSRFLVERGILARRWPFLICYVLGRPRGLQAGEYLFDRPLRPIDVYRKLARGEVQLHSVVIPEGSDRFDIARILHERLEIDSQDFLRATEKTDAIQELDPQATTLEGYLFPDTYRFPRGAKSKAVIAAMLAQFRHVLRNRIPPELRPDSENLHEVITLASLVEKETSTAEERPIVAGVFQKRLKKRMALQCDPTVVYAARLAGRSIGPILLSDLEIDSPFNTYLHPGLPPGPIANPGEASIRAALHPSETEYLYFVSNNRGGHIFSRTLAEHLRNVARYHREVAALRRGAAGKRTGSASPPAER